MSNMTLAQVRAMLQVGSVWRFVIDRSAHGFPNADEIRTIEKVQVQEFVGKQQDGKQKSIWAPFPKAKDISEARDGYLKYTISDGEIKIEMIRQAA